MAFKFQFSSSSSFRDFRGSQIYVRGHVPLCTPPIAEKNFFTQCQYFTMSNGVFNFNFPAVVVFEVLGGPKFTLGGAAPSGCSLAEKVLYPN